MTTPGYLHEFVYRVPAVLGDHVHASITLQHHGVNVRAASSDPGAALCDRLEALDDDGPCIVAMDALQAQIVPDLATEPRWPAWCELARAQGFASMIAMPAGVASGTALALNLYSTLSDPWDAKLIAAADSYAQLAAGMVALRLRMADPEDATAGIYCVLEDDQVVEQAVVAIMRSNECTEPQARGILESASSQRNVTARQVAETILRALTGEHPDLGDEADRPRARPGTA